MHLHPKLSSRPRNKLSINKTRLSLGAAAGSPVAGGPRTRGRRGESRGARASRVPSPPGLGLSVLLPVAGEQSGAESGLSEGLLRFEPRCWH